MKMDILTRYVRNELLISILFAVKDNAFLLALLSLTESFGSQKQSKF